MPPVATKRRCCEFTSGCGRAIRRNLEKARALFHEKFYDTNRYRLGRVGRFRINRKLHLDVPETEMTLRPEDLISAIQYVIKLNEGVIRLTKWTTSTTWAIAACGPSMNWRPMNCARASSNCAAPCRSG